MAGFRIPGPLCVDAQPWDVADGTTSPIVGVPPGPVCAASPLFRDAAPFLPQSADDPSILFNASLNPTRGLSDADYGRAAAALGAEIAAVQAVADVETSGNAFDEHGRPRILFERHYFHRLTGGRFDAAHAAISDATAGGYGKFSEQYGKLEIAYGLDADAALRSAS